MLKPVSVQAKEGQRCDIGSALVSIDEGVVGRDAIGVGRSQIEEIGLFIGELVERPVESGIEKPFDMFAVDFDLTERDKSCFHRQFLPSDR